jgi:uncharacterized protein (UPF0333 family)
MATSFWEVACLEVDLFVVMAGEYYKHVLMSSGNHLPVDVRNAAAAVFWLPDTC